jgi:hypothetical protein
MGGGNDDAGADRLLTQVIVQDLLLDAVHNVTPKKTNHSQIHPCIHQSERIPSGDNTVERRQVLETSTDNLNVRVGTELPAKDIAKFLASIYENHLHNVV